MKKFNTILGTLAIASSLFAATAMADTSTANVSDNAPKLIDKLILSYWGWYSGPSIAAPDAHTNSSGNAGLMTDSQNLDSTLTAGYKINDNLKVLANYRFQWRPDIASDLASSQSHYKTIDPWVSVVAPHVIQLGRL